MSLSKIVQESVEKFDEQFKSSYAYPFVFDETCNEDVKNFIISSQISLLEAELERKKGMMKREHGDTVMPNSHGLIIETLAEKRLYNKLIKEDTTYLTEQIEEIKKLI